jgi:diguanylate cyclase (GGDEF)-like protein/PAS domain S-box-containing protein
VLKSGRPVTDIHREDMSEMATTAETVPTDARRPSIGVYVAVVVAAGIAALLRLGSIDGLSWIHQEPGTLVLLAAAGFFAELRPLKVPRGSETEDVSLSTAFSLAILIGWGTMASCVALSVATLMAGLVARRPLWKSAFNAGQYTLSTAGAGAVLSGVLTLQGRSIHPFVPGVLPAVFLAGLAFFVLNNTLVATAIALASHRSILAANREGFGFQAGTAAAVVSLAPAVFVLSRWSPIVIPLLAVPLFAVYQGGRAATERIRTEDRFHAMAQNAAELVAIADDRGVITYVSPSAHSIIGRSPDSLLGSHFLSLIDHEDRSRGEALLADILQYPGKVATGDFQMIHASGPARQFELVWNNLLSNASVKGIVINGRDVTERKGLEEELAHQAFHDPLTNLANRALFRNRVEHALARSQRDKGPVSVMFLDLDNFKTINDSLGHAAGDVVLFEVARRLRACLRPGDTASRLGGDEFGILLEPETAHDAEAVANRILSALIPPFSIQQKEVAIRASIGIAVSSGPDESADEILRNADVAMYAAKAHGKSRFEIFEPRMHESAVERLELEADLQRAIDTGELFLEYQPIVALDDGRIVGAEALVRWRHPRRGVIGPAGFIHVAEDSGLIVPLGRWVLAEGCRQAKRWADERPGSPVSVSVNVSATELQRDDFIGHAAAIIAETGVDPRHVVLEITESVLMQDADEAQRRLLDLKAIGVRLAMDDFGTGYSSLSYLQRFPMDVLKIDRSFVQGLATGPEDSALARAIVQIGRTLRMSTVAEGIETSEQIVRLRALGCDYGQGNFLAVPEPADKVTAKLRSRAPLIGGLELPRGRYGQASSA